MNPNVTTTAEYSEYNVLTFAQLKAAGIGLLEARQMAADHWQDFENDAAYEEDRKPAHITAKTQKWNTDFAGFAICEDGELTEITMAMIEDKHGDVTAMEAHFVIADWQ